MIILTDCLSEKVDEGCIKVANCLAGRIKNKYEDTLLVSYKNHSEKADLNLDLNPLFVNRSLHSILRKKNADVLYIPFASNTLGSAIRTLVLSLINKKRVMVIFALRHPMNFITKWILKLSRVTVVALSSESFSFYSGIAKDVVYCKTGIDTNKFVPVNDEMKYQLRKNFSLPSDKNIVLHVGHLNYGRNVDKLLNLDDSSHGVLVLSSVTKEHRDNDLLNKLSKSEKITIIDYYIEHIEQLYQMSDVYLFPVSEQGKCIDVPLSVLEAASCNVPIVCTPYGELKNFVGKDGFYFTDKFDKENLNQAVKESLSKKGFPRDAVLDYDWDTSINKLTDLRD